MNDRLFVDTNVLVYLFDESEPEKRGRAIRRLEAEGKAAELVISTQILQELYSALTRGPDPIRSAADAESAVRDAMKLLVVHVDPPLILQAIGGSRQHRISFWDALVVAAAQSAGCTRLLSEDLGHGQVMGSVRIEDPFAELPPGASGGPPRKKRRRAKGAS